MAQSLADIINAKRQKTADKKAGNTSVYRFKQKKTTIRILPSWRSEDHDEAGMFYHEFGQSWIKDMDGNVLAVIGCNKMTFGEDDVVRNLLDVAQAQAKTDAQRKAYKEMKAKPRVLVNALILDDKDVNAEEPQITEFSETQFDTILKDMAEAVNAGDDVLDLEKGFDITVEKSGSGLETKYAFTLARRPSAVKGDPMSKINDIDAYVRSQFVDNAKAVSAIKALTQGEPLALVDRNTDLSKRRSERTTREDVVDAEYNVVDDANNDTVVDREAASDADIEALFGTDD